MPLYGQAEFARLLGKKNSFVSTYITRGKIVKSGDVIDSEVPQNKAIMQKYGVYPGDGNAVVSKTKEIKVGKPDVKTKNRKIVPPPPQDENTGGQYQLDLNKKEAELEFKQVQTRIKLIEEARLNGELIPVKMVTELISTLSRSIILSYKESMDQFLIEVTHRAKISDTYAAELKGLMADQINKSHDTAITNAIKTLKDFSPNIETDE